MPNRQSHELLGGAGPTPETPREILYDDLIFLVRNRFAEAVQQNSESDGFIYFLEDIDTESGQRVATFALGKSLEASLLDDDPVIEIEIPLFMDHDIPDMGVVGLNIDLKIAEFKVRNTRQKKSTPTQITFENFDKKLNKRISRGSSDDELHLPLRTYMDFIRYGELMGIRKIK